MKLVIFFMLKFENCKFYEKTNKIKNLNFFFLFYFKYTLKYYNIF